MLGRERRKEAMVGCKNQDHTGRSIGNTGRKEREEGFADLTVCG